jgi:hypothetical protein
LTKAGEEIGRELCVPRRSSFECIHPPSRRSPPHVHQRTPPFTRGSLYRQDTGPPRQLKPRLTKRPEGPPCENVSFSLFSPAPIFRSPTPGTPPLSQFGARSPTAKARHSPEGRNSITRLWDRGDGGGGGKRKNGARGIRG